MTVYSCFRFFYDDVIAGSSAFLVRLWYASYPRLDSDSLCYVMRYTDFIVAVRSGRRFFYERSDPRACYRDDLERFISVIIGRA